ncbi:MAG: helix-turn-helix transcriptional regulator [Clostridia bacterium]|nr:helix-turn-helix transcriptional regulator [Clostridia bacterium]
MPGYQLIKAAGAFDGESHFRLMKQSPLRILEGYEMELFYEDCGVSILNGIEYPIRRGMLLIARPGDTRSSQLPFRNYFIRLGQPDEQTSQLLDGICGVTQTENCEAYETLFRRISSWFLVDDLYKRAAACAAVYELLHMTHQQRLRQLQEGGETGERDVVLQAEQYIDQRYQEEVSVEEIAKACHVSVSYLHRLFVNRRGVTPHSALNSRRLSAAKSLLINGNCPIADVAWRCGFQSASYFADCFRRCVGVSPRKFRKEKGYQL